MYALAEIHAQADLESLLRRTSFGLYRALSLKKAVTLFNGCELLLEMAKPRVRYKASGTIPVARG